MKRPVLFTLLRCAFVFASFAFASSSARADVALSLTAPEGCPSRAVLVQRVQERASWIRFADTSESLAVDVRITKHPRDFTASIALDGESVHDERSLKASTCAELIDASGLMLALLVQANDDAERERPPPLTPPPSLALTLPPDAAPPPRVVPSRRWSPLLGASLQTELAVLPSPTTGAAVFTGLEPASPDRTLVAPSVRLAASLATSDLAAGPSRPGSYARGVVRADVCPLQLALSSSVTLRPCAWAGVGAVHASGAAVPRSLSETDLWADVGALLRARAGSARYFLELEVGAIVPLSRPVFVIENPRSVVYATPPVGALLALGGGVRFL